MARFILFTVCLFLAAVPGRAGMLELQQALEGSGAAPLLGKEEPVRFFLRLVATCGDDEKLASLAVSIADTRIAPDPGSLDEEHSTELALAVPPRQLQGINRRLLCSDTEASEGSLKLLRGAFSATAAARCTHPERGSRMLYASTDVDVSYWCPGADQSPAAAAGR